MKAKSAEKKPNIFVRMGRKLKEVTWPTFSKVVKATGVVLVVVVIFLVIFGAINYGLGELLKLITSLGSGS